MIEDEDHIRYWMEWISTVDILTGKGKNETICVLREVFVGECGGH